MTPELAAIQSQQTSILDSVAVPEPSVVSQILSLDDITAPQNHRGDACYLLLVRDGCTMSSSSFSSGSVRYSIRHVMVAEFCFALNLEVYSPQRESTSRGHAARLYGICCLMIWDGGSCCDLTCIQIYDFLSALSQRQM